ncbi:MAG: cysteine--tRNA ligase, partial [Candidatus Paceibacterota bacterium]
EDKSTFSLASFFENTYYEDTRILGIDSVDEYAKASDFIPEIIKQIQKLERKGFTYQTSQGVYFHVKKFKNYGKLSKQKLESQEAGWRIDPDSEKKNPADFVLWKFSKTKGEPAWETPWGRGRPGWHIEDTAITEKFFGPQYDWHGGAKDLKFPHHEAEIAQQESASGKRPFVKVWMHTGLLTIEGEKMSKSLKNFTTIRSFLENHEPEILRWMVISNHYRSALPFSDKSINQAKKSLSNIKNFLNKLEIITGSKKHKLEKKPIKISSDIKKMEKEFHTAMIDDFNTPKAIATIFTFINKTQSSIWSIEKDDLEKINISIRELLKSLGLEIEISPVPPKVKALVRKRGKLRSNEQFIKADDLRKKINVLGYEVEDTPIGPMIKEKINEE